MVFNAHQFITVLGCALVGAMIDKLIIMTIVGYFAGTFFTKFSDKKPAGFLRHSLYHIGLPVISQTYPNGLDREFRP